MTYQYLLTQLNHDQSIIKITLNRPQKLNALNHMLLQELEQLFNEIANNPHIRGIMITGQDKAFCAGADIEEIAALNAQQALKFSQYGQFVFRRLETLGKPSIAAINGYALGGGCELAMSASIRIAATTAKFAQPEIKLGLIPTYGGTQRLARFIGKGRAIDLCLSGRTIDANTALQWGLITDICEPEKLVNYCEERLQTIVELAPIALKNILEAIDHGYDLTLEDALNWEANLFALTCTTHDKNEGTQAFIEKRKPIFSGK